MNVTRDAAYLRIGLAVGIVGSWCALAFGDGGVVRSTVKQEGIVATVFTSPNPLRAGPVDVSVLVQDAETGNAIDAADVQVRLTPRDAGAMPMHAVASHAEATNQLLQAALVELPTAGWWDVEVECAVTGDAGTRTVQANFSMEASAALPRWLAVWPWFSWPIGAVLLFAVHRQLATRQLIRRQSTERHR